MTTTVRGLISPYTLLRLGRVSNLPTVWTNVLAGAVLASGDAFDWRLGVMLLAMSLFYVGGMYLNDYFDRAIDAQERPERPIPSGAISASLVRTIGFALLGSGLALSSAAGPKPAGIGLLLTVAIVAYDRHHKNNPYAPVVMGICRALVYCAAAAAVGASVPLSVIASGVGVGAYVAGLTYAARQESLDKVGNLWPLLLLSAPLAISVGAFRHGLVAAAIWLLLAIWTAGALYLLARRPIPGSVGRAVGWLIAGICLCDAALLASIGAIALASAAIAGFVATLFAQQHIAGT